MREDAVTAADATMTINDRGDSSLLLMQMHQTTGMLLLPLQLQMMDENAIAAADAVATADDRGGQ